MATAIDEDQPSHRRLGSRGLRRTASLVIAGSCVVAAGMAAWQQLEPERGGGGGGRGPVSLAAAGTGQDVWQQLEVDAGTYKKDVMRKSDPGQLNMGLADHFASRSEWSSFGRRGSAMGSVKAPHVSSQIELAAQDCGQDPKCVCDWAGSPRACLFSYCCGTIAHKLGQRRGDYLNQNPTPQQRVDSYDQGVRLQKWQQVCRPEQDFYGAKCSVEAVPDNDNRRHYR